MKWYRKLHWQIILGMILGLIYGIAAAQFQWTGFATNWVVPFGDIFMNLLKLIAVPLVLTSLVAGVASLSDFRSEEHTSELQSRRNLVCRLLLEKKKKD